MVNKFCDFGALPSNLSTFAGFTMNSSTLNIIVAQKHEQQVSVECSTYLSTSLEQTIRCLDHLHGLISQRLITDGLQELGLEKLEMERLEERLMEQLMERLMAVMDGKMEAKFAARRLD